MFMLFPLLANAGGSLRVTGAWLRALPPGQPNSAAYMVLNNAGDQALTIVAVTSEISERVEFHESRQQDGMWRMQALAAVFLAAGQTTALAPGGQHLMLFDVKRSPREGEEVEFHLTLEDGQQIAVTAVVRGFGAAVKTHRHH